MGGGWVARRGDAAGEGEGGMGRVGAKGSCGVEGGCGMGLGGMGSGEEGGDEEAGKRGGSRASRAMASRGGNCVVVADAGAGAVRGAGGGQVGASGWWVGGVMSFEVIVAGGIQQKWVCGVDSHGGGCAGCWVG